MKNTFLLKNATMTCKKCGGRTKTEEEQNRYVYKHSCKNCKYVHYQPADEIINSIK